MKSGIASSSRACGESLGKTTRSTIRECPAKKTSYAAWKAGLEKAFETLQERSILVGHSIGGTILLKVLTEHSSPRKLAGVFLIAPPFVGQGGWSADDLMLPTDLGARLPQGVPIHFYQGLKDETAPPSHVELYAHAVPQAHVHRLSGRDHQLNNDLKEAAAAISSLDTERQADGLAAEAAWHSCVGRMRGG